MNLECKQRGCYMFAPDTAERAACVQACRLDQERDVKRLRDIRDVQRTLQDGASRLGHGKPWVEHVRPWCEALEVAAKRTDRSVLALAQDVAKAAEGRGEPYVALRWLAAAVESIEPTKETT